MASDHFRVVFEGWLRARLRDFARMETKDWISAVGALATTVIAAITLWLTSNVSTMQDYFYSEVAKTNTEIVMARREAEALQARNRGLATEIAARAGDLQRLTNQIQEAQTRLGETEKAKEETEHALDIRLRLEAQHAFRLVAVSLWSDMPHHAATTLEVGPKLAARWREETKDVAGTDMGPYYERLSEQMSKTCPALMSLTFSYQEIFDGGREVKDTDDPRQLAELPPGYFTDRMKNFLARRNAEADDRDKLEGVAAACACQVLRLGSKSECEKVGAGAGETTPY